jgi:hypothetical protein
MRRSGSNLASYVLFERPFCRQLLRLGYEDTMARRNEVVAFLGSAVMQAPATENNVLQLHADRAPPPLRIAV